MNINATVIGQSIAFGLFVWFCMRFIWPHLLAMLEQREAKIASGLTAGEQGNKRFAEAEERYQELVQEGKKESDRIIETAKQSGEDIVEEYRQKAKTEGKHLLRAAKADIDRELLQTKENLRQEVSSLVVLGVQQILEREVDAKAHKEILSRLVSRL